jgi:predicted RNA-binding Zn-ribbon protein involved in translation (DUF1610 family)
MVYHSKTATTDEKTKCPHCGHVPDALSDFDTNEIVDLEVGVLFQCFACGGAQAIIEEGGAFVAISDAMVEEYWPESVDMLEAVREAIRNRVPN